MSIDWLIRLAVSMFAFVVVTGFAIDYSRGPWKLTQAGYWLMRSKQAASFTMATALLGALFDWPGRVWLLTAGIFVYGFVNAQLWRAMRKIRAQQTGWAHADKTQ